MRTSRGADPLPGVISREPLPEPSISSLALDCDSILTSLHKMVPLSSFQKLENATTDETARYKIWAANIGALRDANSAGSLDSRLKNSSRMRQNVTSGLERLRDAVNRGQLVTKTHLGQTMFLTWFLSIRDCDRNQAQQNHGVSPVRE